MVSSSTASTRASASRSLVAYDELDALVEEGHLAQARGDRLEVVVGRTRRCPRRRTRSRSCRCARRAPSARICSRSASGAPSWKDWRHRWPRFLTSATRRVDKRVDDRDADAVETTGDLVAAATELAAGVEHRQRHRERRACPGRARCRSGCRDRCPRPGRRRRPGGSARSGRSSPASASSTPLSTISQIRWWRPRSPVEPMYMPGRLRTASRPSRTWIAEASYSKSRRPRWWSASRRPRLHLSMARCRGLVLAATNRGSNRTWSRRSLRSRHSLLLIAHDGRST